jgi:hypothetical protein
MPLFNKPEDVLGMSQEDFKKKLESAASKEDLETLKNEIGASFTSSVEQLKAELAKITTRPADPPPPPPDDDDPTTAVLTDPNGFIDKRTKPLNDALLMSNARLEEMRARQDPKFARIFGKYGADLVAAAEKMPLQQRGAPNFWEWMIKSYVGDKMLKGEIQPESYPTLIGTSSVGPDVSSEGDDPNKGMDPEVAAWLKNRGMKMEDAAKINKIMGKNGDPISLANYKSGNA